MNEFEFEIGKVYIDKGSPNDPRDEFLRHIKGPLQKGIGMMGGIRVLRCVPASGANKMACIIMVSNAQRKPSGLDNPWQDDVDLVNGKILYWGDAKWHPTKRLNDFKGNKILEGIFQEQTRDRRDSIPILFFQKPAVGFVKFCGLCVMDGCRIERFLHDEIPVPNYRFQFKILDLDKLKLDWIHERARYLTDKKAPDVWMKWIKTGKIVEYKVWRTRIKSKNQQQPTTREDKEVLNKLGTLFSPREFEFAIEDILKHGAEIEGIEMTRMTADGGFDFEGTVSLPAFDHQIAFLGEVKKWGNPIGPKEISRLAARLRKGQFGVFITTSYFTKQAQEETYQDDYPIKLIPGSELVKLMKKRGIVKKGGNLERNWIQLIKGRS